MPDTRDLAPITPTHTMSLMFRALGDPRRYAIFCDLACRDEPARVSDLTECCGIDFSGVSRHLKTLREAGLVQATKRGRETLYVVDHNVVSALLDQMGQTFRKA